MAAHFPKPNMTESELNAHADEMIQILEISGYDLIGAKSLVQKMHEKLMFIPASSWNVKNAGLALKPIVADNDQQ